MRFFATAILGLTLLFASAADAGPVCKVSRDAILTKLDKASEFYSLVEAGEKTEAINCCVACGVKSGSKVIVTDMGFASHTVRVLDGDSKGCVGDIATEWIDC